MFRCSRAVLLGTCMFKSSFLTLLSRLERMGLGLLAMSSRFSSKSLALAAAVLRCPADEDRRERYHDHGTDNDQHDCECAHSIPFRASAQPSGRAHQVSLPSVVEATTHRLSR